MQILKYEQNNTSPSSSEVINQGGGCSSEIFEVMK